MMFSSDELDGMQEVMNVSMGTASAALSDALGTYVALSPPRVSEVAPAVLARMISKGDGAAVHAACQAFYDGLEGEVIVIFNDQGFRGLGTILGYGASGDRQMQQEMLLEASSILAGGCLHGIARQLDIEIRFAPPSILGEGVPVERILSGARPTTDISLVIQMNMTLCSYALGCQVLILMPRDAAQRMQTAVARVVEAIYA